MGQEIPAWVQKDRDFIAALLFCALSAYSIFSIVRASDLFLRIELAASVPINMLAGYSFLTRRLPVEKTARGEYIVPLVSFAMPFFIFNVGSFYPVAYSFPVFIILGAGAAALAATSILYLRESFAILPAVRKVVDRGPYRIVRHPLYMAEMLYVLGFMLIGFNLISIAFFVILIAATVWRIIIEERKLGKYPEYRHYMNRVRYRLVPGLF
ncbi:MAG: isoprenylcysteine carboxylmethyltransferase family protein [Euryarchaeota archaeon]|nr:isoprenylcysteine carboxylmethyltransferase family protein [Euryarchaeota archaeon]